MSLDKLIKFIVEVEALAKSRGIDMVEDIAPKKSGDKWHVLVRFDSYESLPPLGIHVSDKVVAKEKLGGGGD